MQLIEQALTAVSLAVGVLFLTGILLAIILVIRILMMDEDE